MQTACAMSPAKLQAKVSSSVQMLETPATVGDASQPGSKRLATFMCDATSSSREQPHQHSEPESRSLAQSGSAVGCHGENMNFADPSPFEHQILARVAQLSVDVSNLAQAVANQSSTSVVNNIAMIEHADIDARTIINVFKHENLEVVTPEHIKGILDEALRSSSVSGAAQIAVLKTAMLVFSDPNHPENLTCYLPNKKTNDAMVWSKTGWEVQPTSLVLPPMAQISLDEIFKKQPYDDSDKLREYGLVLKELASNEGAYALGAELRPILVRNKDLLERRGALAA